MPIKDIFNMFFLNKKTYTIIINDSFWKYRNINNQTNYYKKIKSITKHYRYTSDILTCDCYILLISNNKIINTYDLISNDTFKFKDLSLNIKKVNLYSNIICVRKKNGVHLYEYVRQHNIRLRNR